jgi:rhodanese-related sulfurtransferase
MDTPIEVDVQTVSSRIARGDDFVLLDCRQPNEYEVARIAGATLLPMTELRARVAEIEAMRGKQVIVHCHHGGRSLQVAQWLRGQGFADAQSMAGGIDQWSLEIDPSVPRY